MNKLLPLLSVTALAASGGVSTKGIKDEFPNIGGGGISGTSSFHFTSASFSFENPILTTSEEKEEIPSDYFYCPAYGPFRVGNPNFEATFNYRANIDNQQIIERLRIFNKNNVVVSASSHPSFTYEDNALITTSFTIPIRDYLTRDGITLKFEILNKATRTVLRVYSATIYPLEDSSPSYIYLRSNPYQTSAIGFYGDGESMKEAKEYFDFTGLNGFLDIDYYYRLTLQSFAFPYTSPFNLSYSAVNLKFQDRENLFPYLTHDANSYINVPLSATKNNNKVNFSYKNKFYVNPQTLQISDLARQGFNLTSYFYLPINGKTAFNDTPITIDFVTFGKSQITASFSLTYVVDKTLVGVSDDGLNYVSGGSK